MERYHRAKHMTCDLLGACVWCGSVCGVGLHEKLSDSNWLSLSTRRNCTHARWISHSTKAPIRAWQVVFAARGDTFTLLTILRHRGCVPRSRYWCDRFHSLLPSSLPTTPGTGQGRGAYWIPCFPPCQSWRVAGGSARREAKPSWRPVRQWIAGHVIVMWRRLGANFKSVLQQRTSTWTLENRGCGLGTRDKEKCTGGSFGDQWKSLTFVVCVRVFETIFPEWGLFGTSLLKIVRFVFLISQRWEKLCGRACYQIPQVGVTH